MYKIVWLLFCIATFSSGERPNEFLINRNVERTIDLSTQLVKISTVLTIENTGKNTLNHFHLAFEPEKHGNLSYIAVQNGKHEDLKCVPTKLDNMVAKAYKVDLKLQPLMPGRNAKFTIETVFTKSLTPYPSGIGQKDKQLVRYFGNHYIYSPYPSDKQTTTVLVNSRYVENYSKLSTTVQSDIGITYGPYLNVAPYSQDQMVIHYENNAPFLSVTHMERLIEISHWGNIAVEENIEILHTGAKLKGSFSRYDYQRDTSSTHHSIKSYRTILPATAHNIYYRDSNGNISTSQVKARKDWIELELRPRFPLFGGWKSSYTLGYSVPSYQYLYRKSNNRFVLKMRLIDHIYDDMFVEHLETSVVLPVGVKNVNVKLPYGDVERLANGVTFKYLDYLGRTIIKLRKNGLIEQHIQDLEISYDWQSIKLLHEPISLSLALYVLFVAVIVYVRLDFSINKIKEHVKKE